MYSVPTSDFRFCSKTRLTLRTVGMTMLLVLLCCFPRLLRAAGDEYTLRGDDLQVTVSTKWAGCSSGGYYPIRILVQNRGVDCTLRFQFFSQHEGIAEVERTIAMAQNATTKFTLPVPCVGFGTYGTLQVDRNRRPVEGLTRTVSIPDAHATGTGRPALLVISPTNVDFDPFEAGVTSTLPEATGASRGHFGHYGIAAENHERVEPALLPEEWIAYSGLDFVAVPLPTLAKFSTSERAALLKWVHTGGSLIVYDVGEPAAQSRELRELLNLDEHALTGEEWAPADPRNRSKVTILELDDYGNIVTDDKGSAAKAAVAQIPFAWPGETDTFATRSLMLGRVCAFRDDPFPGSPHDWNWFLQSVPDEAKQWTLRHGISARVGSNEFLEFLIPSVRGVPVFAFLTLITLFTILIGPANYILLWKRRRLYLLVVTIPLIALGTSLALLGYSAVAHGFATKSRARTVTFLDQPARTAVTLARIALYAGLAPSDGLRFSADTSVMPIWPEDYQFHSASTDWTHQQNLRDGWLNSRTRTQFLTIGHRDERGRLEVSETGDRLAITNGFEWDLDGILVADASGDWHVGYDIPAGGSAELVPATAENNQQFRELIGRYPPAPPDLSATGNEWFRWSGTRYFGYGNHIATNFDNSLLEQLISQAERLTPGASGTSAVPFDFAAVLGENPGIELGVESTRPQASLHVLLGRY